MFRSGCTLYPLAQMETPRVGETNQGEIFSNITKHFKILLNYEIFLSAGSHDLARALHPGHGLHHCGAHDSQAVRDR